MYFFILINKVFSHFILLWSYKMKLSLDFIYIFIFDLVFSIFPLPAFDLPSILLMDNPSEQGGSNNSSEQNLEKKLDSILSDREKLIRATQNVNSEDQKKALEDLQKKYPKELQGTETKDDFLDNVDKKLESKTEKLKHENNVWDDADIEHHAPEQIMKELELIEKALKGDANALNDIKNRFPEFYDEESGNRSVIDALKQIEKMLEEEFPAAIVEEEENANKLDEEVKQNIRERNPKLTESEVKQAFDQIKKENKIKREDDDDNNGDDSEGNKRKRDDSNYDSNDDDSKGNKRKKDDSNDDDSKGNKRKRDDSNDDNSKGDGTSGPSIGGSGGGPPTEGPSTGGPSTEGPSTGSSLYSKDLSPLDYVLDKQSCEFPSFYEMDGEDDYSFIVVLVLNLFLK